MSRPIYAIHPETKFIMRNNSSWSSFLKSDILDYLKHGSRPPYQNWELIKLHLISMFLSKTPFKKYGE